MINRIYLYLLIFFVLLLLTQNLRLSALRRRYCLGCVVAERVRMWEQPVLTGSNYTFKTKGVVVLCPSQNASCRILGKARVGDQMRISGVIQPRVIQGVNRGNVLMVQEIFEFHSVKALPGVSLWWYIRVLRTFRQTIENFYKSFLSQPYADLITGIVLGSQGVSRGVFYDALIATGTVHVIAASGFNVTVVAQAIFTTLVRFWRRKLALVIALGAVAAYVLLAGAGASVVRAGLMVAFSLAGQWWGREYWPVWSLILAATLMWLIQPWLIFETSFQLSVAATAGVLLGSEPLLRWAPARYRNNFVLRNLATTMGATLATMPIILIQFQRLSIISPLANVLLLELVPPLMALGAASAIAALVIPGLGQVIAWFMSPLLSMFVMVTLFLSRVPGASVTVPEINWWFGWGWWLILAAWWSGRKGGR